jgi:hypothetical protein
MMCVVSASSHYDKFFAAAYYCCTATARTPKLKYMSCDKRHLLRHTTLFAFQEEMHVLGC